MVKVITPVADEPVTLAEAKTHLRVDVADDDALIDSLITTAREYAEHYSGRSLAPQTLELALDAFPADGAPIVLPGSPVVEVVSITYRDTAGDAHTLDAAAYSLNDYRMTPTVEAVGAWPGGQAVRVRYAAGYAVAPHVARVAMLVMLAFLYECRENGGEPPASVHRLLDTLKVYS